MWLNLGAKDSNVIRSNLRFNISKPVLLVVSAHFDICRANKESFRLVSSIVQTKMSIKTNFCSFRPAGSAGIFVLESSMKSGFGLKYIHKFFNLPFLLVQVRLKAGFHLT